MIDKIGSAQGLFQVNPISPVGESSGVDIGKKFGEILNETIASLNEDHKVSSAMREDFLTGKSMNVEQLLLTGEKASLNLELTVQIRNKMIEAYQEIMRTQI